LPEKWVTFKDYTTICNSAPSEILAIMALQAKEKIIERNLQIIHHNLNAAERFFTDHSSLFTWYLPLAGSIAFPLWLGKLPVDELAERLVNERGVMMVPGSMFDYASQLTHLSQHFRVGLGRRNLPDVLAQLEDFLREAHLL
jgi:aspartate/methionine/tyrosine aminotransferase